MMKKNVFFLLCLILVGFQSSYAQEVPKEPENIISPEVNADRTVTFRFFAPKADTVQVTSDFCHL
jgi:enterochelin esterase family protein